MRSTRIWAGVVALGCAFGAGAAEPGVKPPAQWTAYIAAVRKADAIAGDEARCLAHPDLPGNDWSPDAGKWRCSILRKPMLSLDEIDQLLQAEEGTAELEHRFAQLLDAHYKDQQQREQIFNAFGPFDDSARAGAVAKRWLERSPKSAFANMAMASHHSDMGWKARGTQYAQETPQAQLQRMNDEFALAVPLYLKALEIEPRLSPACTRLAAIGRQSSDELQRYAMRICTKVDPDSYYLALERIFGAQPRWGGSDEALRLAVAYAAARVEKNPTLGALLGEGAGYGPSVADNFGDVVDELVGAVRMAPSGTLAAHAGRGYRVKSDPWSSIAYLSQGLRFWPKNEDWRYERAGQLIVVHDFRWAVTDMQVALEAEPDNGWYHYRMGRAVAGL
jgi:tetratricopeptide (TPR) repeat protein